MDEIRNRKKQKALDELLTLVMNLPLSNNQKADVLISINVLIKTLTNHHLDRTNEKGE